MTEFSHKDTEVLKHLAEEVEHERAEKGHTPFDDIPESEGEDTTRKDDEGNQASPGVIDA